MLRVATLSLARNAPVYDEGAKGVNLLGENPIRRHDLLLRIYPGLMLHFATASFVENGIHHENRQMDIC